jgi:hypothetical protein
MAVMFSVFDLPHLRASFAISEVASFSVSHSLYKLLHDLATIVLEHKFRIDHPKHSTDAPPSPSA